MARDTNKQSFRAKIESIGPSKAWSHIQIPFDVEKLWGSKSRVSVSGKMNGFSFRSSVFPDGKGGHTMMVNQAMQAGAKAGPGDYLSIELEPDTAPRAVTAPSDLRGALAKDKKADTFLTGLSPSAKQMYVDWSTGAKQEETRARRIVQAVEMLHAGKKRT